MRELIFEVTQEADGGFFAECLTDSIVTEADTWDQLRHNVKEVVRAFFSINWTSFPPFACT
jgi:hypothetical protein